MVKDAKNVHKTILSIDFQGKPKQMIKLILNKSMFVTWCVSVCVCLTWYQSQALDTWSLKYKR